MPVGFVRCGDLVSGIATFAIEGESTVQQSLSRQTDDSLASDLATLAIGDEPTSHFLLGSRRQIVRRFCCVFPVVHRAELSDSEQTVPHPSLMGMPLEIPQQILRNLFQETYHRRFGKFLGLSNEASLAHGSLRHLSKPATMDSSDCTTVILLNVNLDSDTPFRGFNLNKPKGDYQEINIPTARRVETLPCVGEERFSWSKWEILSF